MFSNLGAVLHVVLLLIRHISWHSLGDASSRVHVVHTIPCRHRPYVHRDSDIEWTKPEGFSDGGAWHADCDLLEGKVFI